MIVTKLNLISEFGIRIYGIDFHALINFYEILV